MLQSSARLSKSQTIKRGRLDSAPINIKESYNSKIEDMLGVMNL